MLEKSITIIPFRKLGKLNKGKSKLARQGPVYQNYSSDFLVYRMR